MNFTLDLKKYYSFNCALKLLSNFNSNHIDVSEFCETQSVIKQVLCQSGDPENDG